MFHGKQTDDAYIILDKYQNLHIELMKPDKRLYINFFKMQTNLSWHNVTQ